MREEAAAWWEQAQADLKAAGHSIDSGDYHIGAFLCQQSVEKAFKALWIEQKKEMPPKSHNLTELGKGLSVPDRLATALRELNPLFATTRYPDAANGVPAQMYDEPITRERFQEAGEVMEWCRSQLEQK